MWGAQRPCAVLGASPLGEAAGVHAYEQSSNTRKGDNMRPDIVLVEGFYREREVYMTTENKPICMLTATIYVCFYMKDSQ